MATFFQRPGITIKATQMLSKFTVTDAEGNTRHGEPGDYLVTEGVEKEQYIVKRTVFEHKYMPEPEWKAAQK